MAKDYYNTLGVDKTASEDQIKRAYRKMAMKHHPDKNPGNAESESKFKEAAEAYDTLSSKEKRESYDRYGPGGSPFGQGNPFSNGGGGDGGQYGHGFNMEDIFSQFGDIFGSGGQFGGPKQRRKNRGSDLRIKVTLSIEDVLNGTTKKIKYKRQDSCNSCSGKGGSGVKDCIPCGGRGSRVVLQQTPFGQVRQQATCPDCQGGGKQISNKCGVCHGSGTSVKDEVVEVDIPAGVSAGMQLNMRSYGNHVRDGVPGDLHIMIDELREFYFKRDSNNLIVEKEVSVIDAILGAHLKVKTPHGELPITIDEGTPHGRTIRVSGKGIPDVNLGLGDLFVVVNIRIPTKISMDEKYILEKLKRSKNFEA
jgi:molecular chaperone DnaJ